MKTKHKKSNAISPEAAVAGNAVHRVARQNSCWIKKEGLRAFGAWEPLSFLRRLGRQPDTCSQEELYAWLHSEKFIKGLKERGYNLYITHLSKGHGIKEEAEDRQDTKRIVDLCHRHGLYAGGYIRYTNLVPETMRADVPDCIDRFAAKPEPGRSSRYNIQYWRYMPCPTSQEFLDYLDRIIEIGVNQIGIDCLHVDGLRIPPEPYACHCERCRRQFSEWLYRKYPDREKRKQRFGYADFQGLELPDYIMTEKISFPLPILEEPVGQEWVFFRTHLLDRIWNYLVTGVHRRNPACIIQGNATLHPGVNTAFFTGTDMVSLAATGCEGLFSEEDMHPELTASGRICGNFNADTFKKLRCLGLTTFAYNHPRVIADPRDKSEAIKQCMAHQMAFNQDACGVAVGASLGKWPETDPVYLRFHREHRDLFAGTVPLTDAGIYYSQRTVTLNCGTPLAATIVLSRLLMRSHVPYGFTFAEKPEQLNGCRVVLLPETECLSLAEAEAIAEYVRRGGGLIVFGRNTGRYNEIRRRHKKNSLQEALGIVWPEQTPMFSLRCGRGRVGFVDRLVFKDALTEQMVKDAFAATEPYPYLDFRNWPEPVNGNDILTMIRWASGGLAFECTAGNNVAVEYCRSADTNRFILHCVNLDLRQDAGPFEISCCGRRIKKAQVFSPDEFHSKAEIMKAEGGRTAVSVSGFKRYCLVVLSV